MCRIVQYFRSWLVLSAFVCCQADGQIAISLSSGTGIPGATTALNINLNASTSQPAMLQWEMNYSPADISLITVSAGTSATLAGKTVICSSIGTGRIRCLVYGMNGTPVPSGTVAVATVALMGSTTSTSTSIALSNAVAVNPPGSGIATTASGNSLTILQASALVTVATNPPGLSINVDGTTFTAPRTFQWVPGSSHTVNAASPQGSGGTRYSFFSWSDGGAQSHTIAPTSAATYTANFTTQFLLTTSGTGGSIGASPSSPDGYYTGGTSVQLTATPSSGQQFSSWSGDAAGSANPVSVTMSAPRSVTANFTSAPQSITVTTNPPGLSINVDGTPFTAPRTFQWVPGSSHTINAASPQGSGGTRYSFFSWSDGGAQSHTIAPLSASTYTANFTTQFLLTTSGTGGTIGISPSLLMAPAQRIRCR
jgi:hypothetical protein